IKDATEVGIEVDLVKLPTTISQEDLIKEIDKINKNDDIDGLIVQMPLPKQIDEEIIKLAVDPAKDIDGFHPLTKMDPCTPKGIINYLRDENIPLCGKNAVVIGRSNIVGKPMARLLLSENCTVTTVHSRTPKEDMKFYIEHADIIVLAIGKAGFLDRSYNYKPDAVIVDVGINRIDGKLHGDAERDLPVKLQTPVPGGVGLLTRLTLLTNLMQAYYARRQ
ncbi:MAG: bifunctional 5,10-methylenetetrahydrofolate dehydrogenase/5,10-methenyltetrahydrofolate cyclohydrolase, partial [Bacilli bacterium]|nr:bifunctional 5,10-methylenetetrahydrofolate dehydrogenase/5,10-methenyltetrahydrofolate cyclohydrolase [Bacilli bacterium]